jgi:hypothetical protein
MGRYACQTRRRSGPHEGADLDRPAAEDDGQVRDVASDEERRAPGVDDVVRDHHHGVALARVFAHLESCGLECGHDVAHERASHAVGALQRDCASRSRARLREGAAQAPDVGTRRTGGCADRGADRFEGRRRHTMLELAHQSFLPRLGRFDDRDGLEPELEGRGVAPERGMGRIEAQQHVLIMRRRGTPHARLHRAGAGSRL